MLSEVEEVIKRCEEEIEENLNVIKKATDENIKSFPKRIEKVLDKYRKVSNDSSCSSLL